MIIVGDRNNSGRMLPDSNLTRRLKVGQKDGHRDHAVAGRAAAPGPANRLTLYRRVSGPGTGSDIDKAATTVRGAARRVPRAGLAGPDTSDRDWHRPSAAAHS